MELSLEQWRDRYVQQAAWTREIRKSLFKRARIKSTSQILDVGCGPGVLLEEIELEYQISSYGLDIDRASCLAAKKNAPKSILTVGDASKLPYTACSFDTVFSHFLFLWVKDPDQVIREMARVTRLGGFILAIAEPDYGGRIDYPTSLSKIGMWQVDALVAQGANPMIGRELRSLFLNAGLGNIEVGILAGRWICNGNIQDAENEWTVIQSDLHENPEFTQASDELYELEMQARKNQHRILFVPTFYAIGQKK